MSKDMRIGVLGLGFMGATHIQALSKVPNAKLAAVMSRNERRLSGDLSDVQGNLGGSVEKADFSQVVKYRSVEDIIADPELDAVDVCLPTHLHAPVTIAALRAGKHVLVEKPMALDGDAADEMLVEARKQGRVLMTAQVLRFFPSYQALSKLVTSGELGSVRSAIFRRRTSVPTWGAWEFDKRKSGGGVYDLMIHDVDMALHLFGIPDAITSTGFEDMQSGIDMITSAFHYQNVDSLTITGGWHHRGDYPFSMEYTVVGDRGVAEFNSSGRPATVYWADGRSEPVDTEGIDPFAEELKYFVECAQAGREPEMCRPEESAAAVKVTRLMVQARDTSMAQRVAVTGIERDEPRRK
ncbi:MAG: Gfo/Idh/MocA family protein [Bryobacteraceae bacterium]